MSYSAMKSCKFCQYWNQYTNDVYWDGEPNRSSPYCKDKKSCENRCWANLENCLPNEPFDKMDPWGESLVVAMAACHVATLKGFAFPAKYEFNSPMPKTRDSLDDEYGAYLISDLWEMHEMALDQVVYRATLLLDLCLLLGRDY